MDLTLTTKTTSKASASAVDDVAQQKSANKALTADILYITYNRPEYTRLSLERLLETCDENTRLWIWHNGQHTPTLDVVRSMSDHPRVYRFHHSAENKALTTPTNWLWSQAKGDLLGKVDDDCLMPYGWVEKVREAHDKVDDLGVCGCWRFPEEDSRPELANKKITTIHESGIQMLANCWVSGSGYLMKRRCVESLGLLNEQLSFPQFCIRLSKTGWKVGWYYPYLFQEHMDDPRSEHSLLKSDADIEKYAPLTAVKNGVRTLDEWIELIRRDALLVQSAPADPRYFTGWRSKTHRMITRAKRVFGKRTLW